MDALLDARPEATLDLHGFRANEIENAIRNFLSTWQRRAPGRVVHIVTGKGRGSDGGPVLRPAVRRLLELEGKMLASEWSPDVDGGGYLIRLR
jgi:DNA-nicking Smr family endonuclease